MAPWRCVLSTSALAKHCHPKSGSVGSLLQGPTWSLASGNVSPLWGIEPHIQKPLSGDRCGMKFAALWESASELRNAGCRARIRGSESAQLAQNAALWERLALRKPNPPSARGRLDNCRTLTVPFVSCSSWVQFHTFSS